MGYCADVTVKVKIPKEKKQEILDAFKKLDNGKDYHWVPGGFYHDGITVKDLFEAWGFECILSTKGYYLVKTFNWEKLGEDEIMWKALAPLILDGSYVKYDGECGDHWKLVFKDGKMKRKSGRVVYD